MMQFVGFDFYTARWFSRLWCAQECQLGANRVFHFPGEKFSCIAIDSTAVDEILKATQRYGCGYQWTHNGVEQIPNQGDRYRYGMGRLSVDEVRKLIQPKYFGTWDSSIVPFYRTKSRCPLMLLTWASAIRELWVGKTNAVIFSHCLRWLPEMYTL
jgi:hypothetical protein